MLLLPFMRGEEPPGNKDQHETGIIMASPGSGHAGGGRMFVIGLDGGGP